MEAREDAGKIGALDAGPRFAPCHDKLGDKMFIRAKYIFLYTQNIYYILYNFNVAFCAYQLFFTQRPASSSGSRIGASEEADPIGSERLHTLNPWSGRSSFSRFWTTVNLFAKRCNTLRSGPYAWVC